MRIITFSSKGIFLGLIALGLLLVGLSVRNMAWALPSISKHPGTYYLVQTEEKVIALTFDDGPDPLYTGLILDVLKEKDVKATFFCPRGELKKQPGFTKKNLSRGS